ncbi:UPF0220 domain protein [Taphrina deformans PYCC 5710]|uniref:UPF0220 domain protein n=1 Tax=Taphrina deformans (strain PYCC 5710 / ATCC 11124 / CBS 356.35 / IMI 108563 / JCM 9778 / NBRC 8474) TaxID=1097556 RepID=R4XCC5_TAPDE|nr:UPF0220 domain protein [Taphrina deformans PYCC 5710]|eukprot:CCG83522.1 UPF0220 domain protein [Taphrina deformans PYCC 5710]
MSYDQPNSLFRFQIPSLSIGANARSIGIYLSGVLFALGFWFFLDAAIYSKVANAGTVHISFVDWIPAICSSLGMLIVNSIDKSKLTSDNYGESSIAWKAKLILFIGFALLAGGLAGGVVVLVLKYIVPGYPFPTLYFGVANVLCNGLIMLSSVVLWISVNSSEDEYSYQLQI